MPSPGLAHTALSALPPPQAKDHVPTSSPTLCLFRLHYLKGLRTKLQTVAHGNRGQAWVREPFLPSAVLSAPDPKWRLAP